MKATLLAIDQSTTASKVVVMSSDLEVLGSSSHEFKQHYPKPGWVEHDLVEIWDTVCKSLRYAMDQSSVSKIDAIGITNQRETICFWNKKTLEPIGRAIVWQDRRTAADCSKLKKQKGFEAKIQSQTGLLLDPYFSGTKAAWAMRNNPEIRSVYKQKQLACGTIDSFLLAKLTAGRSHKTEPSNASRTLVFDIQKLKFDSVLCKSIGVPQDIWPEVSPSMGYFGETKNVPGIPDGVPITGILGDQQAALFGQACIHVGEAKCTYGTGAFLLLNTGKKKIKSKHRLLTTIAWQSKEGVTTYALEGSAFIAGAAVQWLRDEMKIISSSAEIEALAREVNSTEGVSFVPAMTGLGAPYWDPHARGLISGLTRGSNRAHLARAVLEGIAFQNVELLLAMEKDLGAKLKTLNVDGGASKNNLLMQIQADLLGRITRRPRVVDTTLLGAVFAAGIGAGIWKDFNRIRDAWSLDQEFRPTGSEESRKERLQEWRKAVNRSRQA